MFSQHHHAAICLCLQAERETSVRSMEDVLLYRQRELELKRVREELKSTIREQRKLMAQGERWDDFFRNLEGELTEARLAQHNTPQHPAPRSVQRALFVTP